VGGPSRGASDRPDSQGSKSGGGFDKGPSIVGSIHKRILEQRRLDESSSSVLMGSAELQSGAAEALLKRDSKKWN
jgi:hypothetical protein